ncbi:aspartate aminotransferase family protein [Modestobacter sp. Leaf380]|uniref:pyridoxal phosphate-dependent decarboxylase family protein n=1 Tax=Modestobacter sp. Leaf380 TaxID=1736356 RepID=UPI0026F46632|nr:aspartate aminotransferase family protein [Modestobacter sp. Leaf380]
MTTPRATLPSPGRTSVDQLLTADTREAYRATMSQAVGLVAGRLAAVDAPQTGVRPAALAPQVAAVDLDTPLTDTTAALDELSRLWLHDAVWFHEPTYLAHLNCPVVLPALAAEALASAVNSSLDTWDQSAGATLIEQRLVGWLADRAGLGPDADGVFTSGGTQSNLQALLLARDEACTRQRRHRPDARLPELLSGLRVFTSEVGHFSVQTSAALLGLGEDAVVAVPCDARMRMRPDALAAALDGARASGLTPMAVVGTAGTTDFGSIDPLAAIADLCADHGAWMHVDAAYGGGLLVSPTRRHLLAGVERADSVTVDPHKTFFQPVACSVLLVRDADTLRHVTHHADYLNPEEAPEPNQVDKSLQTTRRFDALKLWTTLRVLGADGIGELVDRVVDLAAETWPLLDADPRIEVVVRPELSTLVFRYVPAGGLDGHLDDDAVDELNRHVRRAVAASGQAVLGGTTVHGRAHLKTTLLNPTATLDQLVTVLGLVTGHAEDWLAQRVPAGVAR